jgi:hypothetical protein
MAGMVVVLPHNAMTNRGKGATHVSKGKDSKRQNKKKPLKTLMEKRAAKRAKKQSKEFSLTIK